MKWFHTCENNKHFANQAWGFSIEVHYYTLQYFIHLLGFFLCLTEKSVPFVASQDPIFHFSFFFICRLFFFLARQMFLQGLSGHPGRPRDFWQAQRCRSLELLLLQAFTLRRKPQTQTRLEHQDSRLLRQQQRHGVCTYHPRAPFRCTSHPCARDATHSHIRPDSSDHMKLTPEADFINRCVSTFLIVTQGHPKGFAFVLFFVFFVLKLFPLCCARHWLEAKYLLLQA